jgi:hypothetical protein
MLNGNITIRGRKLSIFWTGEMAEHLALRHQEDPSAHPYLHLAAQQMLQKCKGFEKAGKSYLAKCNDKKGVKTYVIFFVSGKFAVIKTCYKYGW